MKNGVWSQGQYAISRSRALKAARLAAAAGMLIALTAMANPPGANRDRGERRDQGRVRGAPAAVQPPAPVAPPAAAAPKAAPVAAPPAPRPAPVVLPSPQPTQLNSGGAQRTRAPVNQPIAPPRAQAPAPRPVALPQPAPARVAAPPPTLVRTIAPPQARTQPIPAPAGGAQRTRGPITVAPPQPAPQPAPRAIPQPAPRVDSPRGAPIPTPSITPPRPATPPVNTGGAQRTRGPITVAPPQPAPRAIPQPAPRVDSPRGAPIPTPSITPPRPSTPVNTGGAQRTRGPITVAPPQPAPQPAPRAIPQPAPRVDSPRGAPIPTPSITPPRPATPPVNTGGAQRTRGPITVAPHQPAPQPAPRAIPQPAPRVDSPRGAPIPTPSITPPRPATPPVNTGGAQRTRALVNPPAAKPDVPMGRPDPAPVPSIRTIDPPSGGPQRGRAPSRELPRASPPLQPSGTAPIADRSSQFIRQGVEPRIERGGAFENRTRAPSQQLPSLPKSDSFRGAPNPAPNPAPNSNLTPNTAPAPNFADRAGSFHATSNAEARDFNRAGSAGRNSNHDSDRSHNNWSRGWDNRGHAYAHWYSPRSNWRYDDYCFKPFVSVRSCAPVVKRYAYSHYAWPTWSYWRDCGYRTRPIVWTPTFRLSISWPLFGIGWWANDPWCWPRTTYIVPRTTTWCVTRPAFTPVYTATTFFASSGFTSYAPAYAASFTTDSLPPYEPVAQVASLWDSYTAGPSYAATYSPPAFTPTVYSSDEYRGVMNFGVTPDFIVESVRGASRRSDAAEAFLGRIPASPWSAEFLGESAGPEPLLLFRANNPDSAGRRALLVVYPAEPIGGLKPGDLVWLTGRLFAISIDDPQEPGGRLTLDGAAVQK